MDDYSNRNRTFFSATLCIESVDSMGKDEHGDATLIFYQKIPPELLKGKHKRPKGEFVQVAVSLPFAKAQELVKECVKAKGIFQKYEKEVQGKGRETHRQNLFRAKDDFNLIVDQLEIELQFPKSLENAYGQKVFPDVWVIFRVPETRIDILVSIDHWNAVELLRLEYN